MLLRFDHDRWVAIDNGSLNGLFVNGRRLPAVDINDGLTVNIGNPDGPLLRFEVGRTLPVRWVGHRRRRPCPAGPRHRPHATAPTAPAPHGRGPDTGKLVASTAHLATAAGLPQRVAAAQPSQPSYPTSGTGVRPPRSASVPLPTAAGNVPTQMGPTAIPPRSGGSGDGSNLATSMLKILRPGKSADVPEGSIKIGRATDNDIVIPDVLASRHHATLVPSATGPGTAEILDNRSINGTFVNGQRVESRPPCTTATSSRSATSTSSSPTAR